MSTVPDLLRTSREAHQRYHVASGEIYHDGRVKRYPHEPGRVTAIQEALDARLAAEAMDPDHSDPAWDTDLTVNRGISSADLLTFYTTFLSTP